MTEPNTTRIEKQILLPVPKARVWHALTDPDEFGSWFGVKLDGKFGAGKRVAGKITHPGYEHLTMEMTIECMDAECHFAFRWHPYAVDPKTDYSGEPMTLVEFRLEDVSDGSLLRVSESGFDQIPVHRRAEAFRMNSEGWAAQMENVRRFVVGLKAA